MLYSIIDNYTNYISGPPKSQVVAFIKMAFSKSETCHPEGAFAPPHLGGVVATEGSLAMEWRCFAEFILSEANVLSMTLSGGFG
jgi:hypothetical protein